MPAPVVFVSYSHDSPAHKRRVAQFAARLRSGLDCDVRFDEDAAGRVANWPVWMRRQIAAANFVFMVFTRRYRRCFDQNAETGEGRGVTFEGAVIQNTIYASAGDPGCKFIPVALTRKDLEYVPRDVFGGSTYVLAEDWPRICRHLSGQSRLAAGPVRAPVLSEHTLPILFVAAEKGTGLDLRGQLARTKAAIAEGRLGARVQMTGAFDLTPDRLIMHLNRSCPAILHLSGRQEHGQVKMHDEKGRLAPVPADTLAALLGGYHDKLRLVVLDTCDSLPQAAKLAKTIGCAIGVAGPIAEPVAIDFFAMFYNSVASGHSVQRAYDVALALQLAKIQGNRKYLREVEEIVEAKFDPRLHLPRIATRAGIRAKDLYLIE
jgi:hypothetical protein